MKGPCRRHTFSLTPLSVSNYLSLFILNRETILDRCGYFFKLEIVLKCGKPLSFDQIPAKNR